MDLDDTRRKGNGSKAALLKVMDLDDTRRKATGWEDRMRNLIEENPEVKSVLQ